MDTDSKVAKVRVIFSRVNRAWFVVFGATVLRVFNDKQDALDFLQTAKRDVALSFGEEESQ